MQENSRWLTGYMRRRKQLLAAVMAVLCVGAGVNAWMLRTAHVSSVMQQLDGLTVLVDAGHGGYDGGARGKSGVWEKEINLQVALLVKEKLAALGAEVILTRDADEDLCSEPRPANLTKKRQDMIARVDIAKEHGADMVLSIHMNHYRDRSQSGPQVFYRKGCDAGRLLAGCMQESLIAGLSPQRRRSALSGDYFILQLDVPSVLIECGFLSNPAEEQLLLDGSYQERIAQAVADGAAEYMRLSAGM